ncbi:MAG: GGDEF domain-containing protein [candidate division Zixibacteria bacterium]|nr:GGDEF domain-containing protein [candidate division Zixibacteria bacterium]
MSQLRFRSRHHLLTNTGGRLALQSRTREHPLPSALRELVDDALPGCGETEWTARVGRALAHFPPGALPHLYLLQPSQAQLVSPGMAANGETNAPPATLPLNPQALQAGAALPLQDCLDLEWPAGERRSSPRESQWVHPFYSKGRLLGCWIGDIGPGCDAGVLELTKELEHWIATSYDLTGLAGAELAGLPENPMPLAKWLSADSLLSLCAMAAPDFREAHGLSHLLIVAHTGGWPQKWALTPWDEHWRAVDEWYAARTRDQVHPRPAAGKACPTKSSRLTDIDLELQRAGFRAGASIETGRSTSYCVFWIRGEGTGPAHLENPAIAAELDGELLDGYLWKQFQVALGNMARLEYLRELSHIDSITGVFNRRYFNLRLTEETSRARRFERPMSLLVFDIDHFKELNDSMGHQAGDTILHRVADHVRWTVRSTDLLCRLSGDEFCILMSDTDLADCLRLGERLQQTLRLKRFAPGAGLEAVPVQISIGGAVFPTHATDAETILWCADMALLEAKQQGRNRFLLYEASMRGNGCAK